MLRCQCCSIVPDEVLHRFANNRKLPAELRKAAA